MLRFLAVLSVLTIGSSAAEESKGAVDEKLFRGSKVVQLLAAKGETIFAGPLTVFIDPSTHRLCKEVVADPGRQLIPAIYRYPGGQNRVALYLIRPILARPKEAVFRGSGNELLLLVPDNLGKRDVRKRTFWIEGQREGRRFVRELGFYEVVAYTSRDIFGNADVSNLERLAKIHHVDGNGPEEEYPLKGYVITGIAAPPEVKLGQSYAVTVDVLVQGDVSRKLLLTLTTEQTRTTRVEVDLAAGSQRVPITVEAAQKEPTEESFLTHREMGGAKEDEFGFRDMNALTPVPNGSERGKGYAYSAGLTIGADLTTAITASDQSMTEVQVRIHQEDAQSASGVVDKLRTNQLRFEFPRDAETEPIVRILNLSDLEP